MLSIIVLNVKYYIDFFSMTDLVRDRFTLAEHRFCVRFGKFSR